MPRPVKCRKVCHFPNVLEFFPADDTEKKTPIVLTVDEYETIRLLDKKGYSQEQCAASMQVARTTVQRIYEIARKKIADALICLVKRFFTVLRAEYQLYETGAVTKIDEDKSAVVTSSLYPSGQSKNFA